MEAPPEQSCKVGGLKTVNRALGYDSHGMIGALVRVSLFFRRRLYLDYCPLHRSLFGVHLVQGKEGVDVSLIS